jgi:ATP-dependent RNA helicase SUPV3L1/SUV3
MCSAKRDRVTAILGPTNTGKTYLAIERMLGHDSGMIGFPLRLLARENYDRVLRLKGRNQVALITGEEKIVPPQARYFVCTVESMPVERPVEFLAVDEVQLAADAERGHIFTDRLFYARGLSETMFLGADTIRPLLARLVPEAVIISRPRFSTLTYTGAKKVTRLPSRSAVVAFSAAEVYALAELIRRQRGGTALVLGALSPRTRNAQVAMFESGEVDYLVATDAIGMGLNLGLDHVAFAKLVKFDGQMPRRLAAAEVAQIAGRAGRHMNDGSFGATAGLGAMDEELVGAVEQHSFDPLTHLFWRSRDLDYRSPTHLLRSLEQRPSAPELIRVRPPDDQQALAALAQNPEIEDLAADPEGVRLLWDVCQVPDFRKTLSDHHARLLAQVFRHLRGNDHRLPEDWVARQIDRIERFDGDIDALTARISHIRTWTFITHRPDWLDHAADWQERTRTIEDRLSDALHQRLTQRFVDRRAAVLAKRLQDGSELLGAVRGSGEVLVEGEHVGQLTGFQFRLDASIGQVDARPVLTATRRALQREIPARLTRLEADNDGAFRLSEDGELFWRGACVARLSLGASPLAPAITVHDSEFLDGASRERIRKRLAAWLERHLRNRLGPLYALETAALQGAARGLAFQLAEALGSLPRSAAAAQLDELGRGDRKALAALKVKIGAQSLYLPALLKPAAVRLRALLWAVHHRCALPELPAERAVSFTPDATLDDGFCLALGYRRFSRRGVSVALRVDVVEQLAYDSHKLAQAGPFAASPALARRAGCDGEALLAVLTGLGYRLSQGSEGPVLRQRASRSGKASKRAETRRSRPSPCSPS